MDLPQPQAEMPAVPEVTSSELQAEAPAAIAIEKAAPSIPPTQIPPAAVPLPDPAAAVDPGGTTAVSATPAIADDSDLIEKEWVVKAKEIVEKTKHDPYLQTKEMSKVKADYLKKRYNKDLKVSGD